NGPLTTDSFTLNGGAYNGSGSLAVASAFSHLAGALNTTGAVSITQATGSLSLTQSLSAGSLTVSVPAGSLGISGGVTLQSSGAMALAANGIAIQDATFNAASLSLSGSGNATLASGNVVFGAPLTSTIPVIAGGAAVTFAGPAVIPTLTLNGGSIGGTRALTAAPPAPAAGTLRPTPHT